MHLITSWKCWKWCVGSFWPIVSKRTRYSCWPVFNLANTSHVTLLQTVKLVVHPTTDRPCYTNAQYMFNRTNWCHLFSWFWHSHRTHTHIHNNSIIHAPKKVIIIIMVIIIVANEHFSHRWCRLICNPLFDWHFVYEKGFVCGLLCERIRIIIIRIEADGMVVSLCYTGLRLF